MNNKVLIWTGCGCPKAMPEGGVTLVPYITEDSPTTPQHLIYYESSEGAIYTPESYNEMDIPKKFIEITDAPELNAMSYFVGVQDNGSDPAADYKFTPAQLISYIGQSAGVNISVGADGNSLTLPEDLGFDILDAIWLGTNNQFIGNWQFTKTGLIITMNAGESNFFEGQNVRVQFG